MASEGRLLHLLFCNLKSTSYLDHLLYSFFQVVGNTVRQLQHLVTDESCVECHDLFVAETKKGGTGGSFGSAAERLAAEVAYQKEAERLLSDENCLKIILVRFQASVYRAVVP